MSDSPWDDELDTSRRAGPLASRGESPPLEEQIARYMKLDFGSRDRFVGAIAAILMAPLVIDVPIAAIERSNALRHESEFIFMLALLSVTFAKFCLLAVWLAWGGSRLIWRVIVVFASLLFTCLAFFYDTRATEGYSTVLLACAVLAAASASPKLFGVRWVSLDSWAVVQNDAKPAHTPRQFTLVDMFIWTATVAVVFGVIRWLGFPRGLLDTNPIALLLTIGCWLGYPAVGTLLAMWAALAPGPSVGPRCAVAWLAMLGLLTPILGLIGGGARDSGEAVLIIVAAMSSTMFLVFAPLLILRSWGHRLVRQGKLPYVAMPHHG